MEDAVQLDVSDDSICTEDLNDFIYNKNPFTYPYKSIHIECDFIGGQSFTEIEFPAQDVTLCTGKPNINGLVFCVEPGDKKIVYLWRSCNGGKESGHYLHCLHSFLTTYKMGAGHLTLSHDRGGHLHNQIVMRYYHLITSASSRKGERFFFDIEVYPYTTGHSGNTADRISCLFEQAFRRRNQRFFTLDDRVQVINDDFPGIDVHIVENFLNIPDVLKRSGVYLNLRSQPDLTLKGHIGVGLLSMKPLSWEFGWSEKYSKETDEYGYRRHQDQLWVRNSTDINAPRRRFWLVAKKWRGKKLPFFFKSFNKSKMKKPGMQRKMFAKMKEYARIFAQHD